MHRALVFFGLVVLSARSMGAQDRPIAIRGGTIIPMSGPQIANGTVVLRGGKIVALGANAVIESWRHIAARLCNSRDKKRAFSI